MQPLTREEVIEVAGPLDDGRILQIIETGASKDELLEAFTWLSADDALARGLHREPHGRIAQLCEILERPDIATDRDRDPGPA